MHRRGNYVAHTGGPTLTISTNGETTTGIFLDPNGSMQMNNTVLNGERYGFRGDFRETEFTGVTFSPDGQWMFFNIQTPGITFAVTGALENCP